MLSSGLIPSLLSNFYADEHFLEAGLMELSNWRAVWNLENEIHERALHQNTIPESLTAPPLHLELYLG